MVVKTVTISWNVSGRDPVEIEMSNLESIVTTLQNLSNNGVAFRTTFKDVVIPDDEL
jgi:hypothetical protein